ncbi:synaptojanin 2 binding protein, isoform CRA_a [Rattus norvegicus]|uniref:Synaptojanin 2 binding protein, isoform CRA_a n=1 Tax=Rattus norvegicus TaxID=10116 RepID=A6JDN0_RAT|nr:synaptojanin 2 binding protein, isoform CRA_a [Rattus norvegicus]
MARKGVFLLVAIEKTRKKPAVSQRVGAAVSVIQLLAPSLFL